jgi:hypothetical protein
MIMKRHWGVGAPLLAVVLCLAADLASAAQYYEMKNATIIVHTEDSDGRHDRPALHLLIPATWKAEGGATINQAAGGCFVDVIQLSAVAQSADETISLQILPARSWEWIEDPAAQRQLQAESQKDARFHLQSCPLKKPVHAAEFLRDEVVPKLKDATVGTIEPFPELERIARFRLGLPADGTGNPGGVHTEAARAKVSFTDAKGRKVDSWVGAVILVRALASARGTFYDWHVIDVMAFMTPPGKLESNDKLSKLMVSTIRIDPQWQQYTSNYTASLYRMKQQMQAQQAAMIAKFQRDAADIINGVTQRAQQGADAAFRGQDQLIRGVQTFRNPATGATMELSNQYDHAWLNGGDRYVMSDDPNFNPNGQLNGSWTELQAVRPAP